MRNLRAPRRKLRLLLLSTVLLTVGAGGLFAAVRADADSVGTLQVQGTFSTKYHGIDCSPGTPTTIGCYRNVGDGVLAGLGKVSVDYTNFYDDYLSTCGRLHAHIPIVVAGKGEIDIATRTIDCILSSNTFPTSELIVTGGSGLYAGASGSGLAEIKKHQDAPGSGTSVYTWTGTVNVPGLSFDTTPPQITGATSKTVKTRTAKGTRVSYSVSAADATDGPVPTTCLPKSGKVFRVGRTSVTCNSVDGSGNTATTRFVITVKRMHR
jgi:hypothetical protein